MKEEILENLEAYFDGELSPEEAACMETQLQAQPELQKQLEQFKFVSEQLAQLPKARVSFDLTASILDKAKHGVASPFALADSPLDFDFLNESVIASNAGGESASQIAQKEIESSPAWEKPSIGQRITRAMLWPVLVLFIAIGLYLNHQPENKTSVAIHTTPSDEDVNPTDTDTSSLFSNQVPFIDPNGQNSVPVPSQDDSNSDANTPMLLAADELNNSPVEANAPVPANNAVSANTAVTADNPVPDNTIANDTGAETKQPRVFSSRPVPPNQISPNHVSPRAGRANYMLSPAARSSEPNEQDISVLSDEPVQAVQTSGPSENIAEESESGTPSDDRIASDNKNVKMAIQCRFDPQNFDADQWYSLLEQQGITVDKSKQPVDVGSWTWEATPAQRSVLMEKASQVKGVLSAESQLLNITPDKVATEKFLTEIRLIPAGL